MPRAPAGHVGESSPRRGEATRAKAAGFYSSPTPPRFDKYLLGASWCDLLHAYNVGPNAFKAGKRNWPYVNKIIGWANQYTELKA
ncbi:hypothetical protein Mrose_00407 [Calidithermus roseus]|uniref:Transglycosylase SLT domain-containing protein n=1 Tax=Calidithermus roseus TaxID=1644118 RepID=A0A399EXE1_9DEIN|nr:hypothetical protein Mrose_00407 [Calidithermus roseus]